MIYDLLQPLLGLKTLKDLPETSPPGATYWAAGLLISLIWPFGIPFSYALACGLPLGSSARRLWIVRCALWLLGLAVWLVCSVYGIQKGLLGGRDLGPEW